MGQLLHMPDTYGIQIGQECYKVLIFRLWVLWVVLDPCLEKSGLGITHQYRYAACKIARQFQSSCFVLTSIKVLHFESVGYKRVSKIAKLSTAKIAAPIAPEVS